MRKAALALTMLALAACNRQKTYESPQPTASTSAQDTWVAQGSDLSPEQVRMVQRALADRGFVVEPSGSFDDQTKVALHDFQRSRGLPETGNLNADTAAALGLDPNAVMPVRGSDETASQNRAGATGAPSGESGGPSGMSGSTGGSAPGSTSGSSGSTGSSSTTTPSPQSPNPNLEQDDMPRAPADEPAAPAPKY